MCFLVPLLFAVSLCHAKDKAVEVVGTGECADCALSNFKTSQAFSGTLIFICIVYKGRNCTYSHALLVLINLHGKRQFWSPKVSSFVWTWELLFPFKSKPFFKFSQVLLLVKLRIRSDPVSKATTCMHAFDLSL